MKNHCDLFHSKGCTECPEYKTSKSGKGKFFQNFQSVGCNFCATDDQVFKSKKALKEHKIFFHSLKCHSCRVGAVQENLKDLKEYYEERLQNNTPPDSTAEVMKRLKIQSITSDIDIIQKNVSIIEILQTRILHAVSKKDVEKEKDNLNDLNESTTKVANKIKEALKTQHYSNEKNEKETTKLTSQEQNDESLRLASQNIRFAEVWSKFNELQLEFRKKQKATVIKQAKIMGVIITDEKIEEMITEGRTDGLFGGILCQSSIK